MLQPVSEVRFEVAEPEFYRAVRISTSDDAKQWRAAGSGDIYRVKLSQPASSGDPLREKLRVAFPETRARFFRVEILDRNDAPLAGLSVRLFTIPRSVVFRAEPARNYRLLYGNHRASAPEYNMARIVDAKSLDAATPATLGAEEQNPSYEDPAPWSERNPAVLWVALGVAVLLLGVLALRALRA